MSSRSIFLVMLGLILFTAGLYLVYGKFSQRTMQGSELQYREVLFSPGIALIGAGLLLIFKLFVNYFRK